MPARRAAERDEERITGWREEMYDDAVIARSTNDLVHGWPDDLTVLRAGRAGS